MKESTEIFKQRDKNVSLVLLFHLKMTLLAVQKPDWKEKKSSSKERSSLKVGIMSILFT